MEAKFGNFSEMANLLSVKSRVSSDLTVLFDRFSLGRLLSRMGIRKEQGYSLVQLIMAICMFRVCGKTIHSAYMANFHGLVETGKNCYYRLLERQSIANLQAPKDDIQTQINQIAQQLGQSGADNDELANNDCSVTQGDGRYRREVGSKIQDA